MTNRYRQDRITHDLKALGLSLADINAISRCEAAAGLAVSEEQALGSIYVLEGSTLGGQMISRALQSASWLPPGGLTYFHPYGDQTGFMWRELQSELQTLFGSRAYPLIERGALETFALLQSLLISDDAPVAQLSPVVATGDKTHL